MVLDYLQGLVRCAGLSVRDNRLDVFNLAESRLHDNLKMRELSQVLTSEWAEAESRIVEVRRLEEREGASEENLEVLSALREGVDELAAERVLLTARSENEKAQCETLATRTRELEVAALRRDGELATVVQAVRSLKCSVSAVEDKANTAGNWAREKFQKMSKLQALVQALN